jgi:hypothetical protein
MRVQDLSGRTHVLNLKGYQVSLDDTRQRSNLHLKCRSLLYQIFPLDIICEEVPIPGESLFLDFLISVRKIAVEVQGSQHDEYVPFFHKNDKNNFSKAQKRDKRKASWCSLNNIRLVTLNHDESESEWRNKILAG